MVAGAFTGWLAVYSGASLWQGVAVAALTTARCWGCCMRFSRWGLALSQHVSGLGLTLLATALSYYGYRVSFPKVSTPPTITPFAAMDWLGLPVLKAQQTPLTLLALLLVPVMAYLLYKTPVGLAVRMGDPQAAEGQGVSVAAVRTGAIVAGSSLMGVAGALRPCRLQRAFLFQHGQRPWLDLCGAGGVCLMAAWQGLAGCAALCLAF